MSFQFTENFDLMIPDVEEQLSVFNESSFSKKHGLIIEVAAIHAGATANFNHYSEEQLEKAVNSWLEPYPKPIVINHDIHSEPLGRVMGAKMDKEADGTPFTRLQVAVLDPVAIKKVSDGRYLTGSVGGKADEAVCSVCNTDWAKPSESRGLPCVHQRGKVYSGKIAMLDMRNIAFKEYSFVNAPADGKSSIRKIGETDETTDSWTRPARFFVLDMVNEGIVEYQESEQERDILEGMRKKDALPLYTGLKGAFIIAQTIHEEELSIKDSGNVDKPDTNSDDDPIKENEEMANESAELESEDILAAVEELSADLADDKNESEGAEEAAEDTQDSEEKGPEDEDNDSEDEESAEEVDEGERPEGQEKPKDKDVDPETSEGAPKSREEDEDETLEEDSQEEGPEDEEKSEDEDGEDNEDAAKESDEDAELNAEEGNDVEPQIAELEAKVAKLEERNRRLEAALKRQTVERVVDAKITLGLVEADDRASEIEEHAKRHISSLTDSLRDLAKMEPKVSGSASVKDLEMDQTAEVVGNENNVSTMTDQETQEEESKDPLEVAEDLFADILMGRRHA